MTVNFLGHGEYLPQHVVNWLIIIESLLLLIPYGLFRMTYPGQPEKLVSSSDCIISIFVSSMK